MNDELINQLAVQVARLENRIDALEASQGEEAQGDTIDDLFLRMETGGGGGGGGGDPQGTFRWEGDKITHCNFYAAHQVFQMPNVTVAADESDGTWYLNVPHGNPAAATVSKTQGPNDDDNTCIPLFMVQDGEIVADYRGMPFVPIYA